MRTERRNLWMGVATLFVLVTAATDRAAAQGKAEGKDPRSLLPPAVAKSVEENRPGARIDKLEIEKEAGITLYDIEFKEGAGEIEVAEDGTVLDVATLVDMKEVPEAAAAVILKAARGAAIKQVEKSEVRTRIEKQGGKGRLAPLARPEYVYEAEMAKGGEIEVSAEGKLIKGPKPMGRASSDEK